VNRAPAPTAACCQSARNKFVGRIATGQTFVLDGRIAEWLLDKSGPGERGRVDVGSVSYIDRVVGIQPTLPILHPLCSNSSARLFIPFIAL
jgi:hypothetical protein